jgi:uncharacterized cupin superfamily protein
MSDTAARPAASGPAALHAGDAPPRARASGYPSDLSRRVAGRDKRPLGDLFGLGTFGVNLTRLAPAAWSALHHRHGAQDEFVYVLEGTPVLVTDAGETQLAPGMCAGFPAGGTAHHLENRGTADVVILEVGDRGRGDSVVYPDDDLAAAIGPDGAWRYSRKDGSPL